jgi:hypothetical protein
MGGPRSALPGPGNCNGRRGWMDPCRLSRAWWHLTGGVGRAAMAESVVHTVDDCANLALRPVTTLSYLRRLSGELE